MRPVRPLIRTLAMSAKVIFAKITDHGQIQRRDSSVSSGDGETASWTSLFTVESPVYRSCIYPDHEALLGVALHPS
jgi:hypothetical protein